MEGRDRHKHRLKGLFSKEKKSTTEDEIDSFLHVPSDQLNFPAPAPSPSVQLPRLAKIDTNNARRWPTAAEVGAAARGGRGRSASPKRNRRGRVVRFTDEKPVVIGEGGEEAEEPTISLRNRANSHPQDVRTADARKASGNLPHSGDNFRPAQVRRMQTKPLGAQRTQHDFYQAGHTKVDSHDATSFAEKVKADMRAGEGKALVQATSNMTSEVEEQIQQLDLHKSSRTEISSHLDELQLNTMKNAYTDTPIPPQYPLPPKLLSGFSSAHSSSESLRRERQLLSQAPSRSTDTTDILHDPYPIKSSPSGFSEPSSRKSTNSLVESPLLTSGVANTATAHDSPRTISRSSTLNIHEAAINLGDEALRDFSTRVTHLFTLFRLSAEAARPLSKCSLQDFTKAALWWFLHGRLNLEAVIRDRPANLQAQQVNFLVRQQAYADLAKSLWIIEQVIPEYHDVSGEFPNKQEVMNLQQGVLVSMRKLTMSMKRNNFLPPEDAPLPQGLNPAIWTEEEGNASMLASQRQDFPLSTALAMPLGDSMGCFCLARMFATGFLFDEYASQQYQCPVLVSLCRDQKERCLSLIITNQSGILRLRVQADTKRGPIWDHVTWHAKSSVIDLKLPQGFMLQIRCAQNDFRVLVGIYDYESHIHKDMSHRRDEEIVVDSTVKAFQYFGNSSFPAGPLPDCQLRLFSKFLVLKAAMGARKMHQGFRIGLATHPSSKNVKGISQDLPPTLPTQFGFLRGDGGLPAFLLKIDDGKQKFSMVFTFENPSERSMLHAQLTGSSLLPGEAIIAEIPVKSLIVTGHVTGGYDSKCFQSLAWQSIRVINEEQEDLQSTKCVLSENLRLIMDFKTGILTDRVNVGPGELKIRLDVNSSTEIKILRQPQADMTISVLESEVSQNLPSALSELLNTISNSETIRTYVFPSIKELHLFQVALTGFSVIFDGMVASFNISRRRMVVPIYKKWEAGSTRVQVVKKGKAVQLLAFFENFSHGECMNFILKSTDIFETSSKSGKYSLRVVDAKFPLPKGHEAEGEGHVRTDRGFVCLDSSEYPGEHDDIMISFEKEEDREKLVQALPAPAKAASRMQSVRR